MIKYLVGYVNSTDENEFVILVMANSRNVAEFVSEAYEKAGMPVKVEVLEAQNLPKEYKFSYC